MSMTAENSEFNSDDYMTRKDFAYILARVAGYESGYRSDRGFSDLSPDDMTAEAVSYLANIGVVSGTGNGAFRPEDYITHLQAAKMAVTALGFSDIVRAKYPNNPMGYVILANELKLFGGYGSDSMNLPVSCRDAVEILFKTAQCPIASPETYSGGSVRISRDESETLLSRKHNIYKSEGIMTDNGITSLDGKTSVRRGGAVIGDVCLTSTSEGSSFENFIGERVEFWYNEKEQKLLYAYSKQNDSDILRIDYDELLPENDGFNITGVVYRKGSGSVRTAKISPVHKFIYNGSSYPSHSSEDLKISAGYMELIDINGDDIFDIIRVNEYTDDVIHYIDVEEGFIKTKYHELMLKTADWKNISVYMPDGTVGSVYELALNQPVSLLLSKDRVSLTLIDCSKRAVTGKLSAADIDDESCITTVSSGDKSTYLYITADEDAIGESDRDVTVLVDYYDDGTDDAIFLEYAGYACKSYPRTAVPYITGTDGDGWKQAVFRINNAYFTRMIENGSNDKLYGCDFRLSRRSGAPLAVSKVEEILTSQYE